MYENPNQFSRYDAQAMEARVTKRLDTLEQKLLRLLQKRQATYSIKQFAEETGLSRSCVLKRCQRGKIEARQEGPGSSWSIKGSEVDRYLEEAKQNQW